jgi:hypothetical protein
MDADEGDAGDIGCLSCQFLVVWVEHLSVDVAYYAPPRQHFISVVKFCSGRLYCFHGFFSKKAFLFPVSDDEQSVVIGDADVKPM